jgi:hypothetical protein
MTMRGWEAGASAGLHVGLIGLACAIAFRMIAIRSAKPAKEITSAFD